MKRALTIASRVFAVATIAVLALAAVRLTPTAQAQVVSADILKLEILNGHSGGEVRAVAVSSDGKLALTGSSDETAILWDLTSGRQMRRFVGHERGVTVVTFSSDGQYVLTASDDRTARLWETATGKQIRIFVENRNGLLIGHSGKILTAAVSPDGNLVATGSEDRTARIWDLKTGKQLFQLDHPAVVNSLAFSPDSKHLLTGGDDPVVRLFSTTDGGLDRKYLGHTHRVSSVAFSPDGQMIVSGADGQSGLGARKVDQMRLWKTESAVEVRSFVMKSGVTSVSFTPNGKSLLVVNDIGNIEEKELTHILDIATGKDTWTSRGSMNCAAMTPDGKRLLYVEPESPGSVHIVSVENDVPETELRGRSSGVTGLDLTKDSLTLFTGGLENSGRWEVQTGRTLSLANNFNNVSFSPDGKLLATSTYSGSISIFDANTLKELTTAVIGVGNLLDSITFSPNGRLLAAATAYNSAGNQNDQKISIWEVAQLPESASVILRSKKEITIPSKSTILVSVTAIDFSPDSKLLAASTRFGGNGVLVFDVETGQTKTAIENQSGFLDVAFSPDGKTMATASAAGIEISAVGIGNASRANSVQFWEVASGKELDWFGGVYKASSNTFAGYKSLAFSPDGKFLAVGGYDGTVYLRNNETKTLTAFEGHNDLIENVKFAKDANGQVLVFSASLDSTTRIWNATTGEEICKLVTFRDGTWAVVDPKGRYDAPNGGEIDGIQWVYGNETIALNQLKDVFYTPNLLPRLLGYNKEPLRPVPDLNTLKLFPKIVEQKVDASGSILTVKLKNRGGGIGEVRVLVNGKLATEDARDERQRSDPYVADAVVTFDLKGSAGFDPAGANSIEVITNNYDPAIGKGYISSRSDPFLSGPKKEKPIVQPKLFAVIAGVSDYTGDQIDLKFATKDAEDFANALGIGARRLFCPKEKPECTEKVKIDLLTTSGKAGTQLPTKVNIKAAFAAIAKEAGPDDILLVYLAGHGASLNLDGSDNYLYLTQDADKASKDVLQIKEYREAATISSTELLDWMTQEKWIEGKKGIQALKQVMILDTCAAGAFEQKVSLQKQRDLSADQIRALERLKDRTGLQILMGSAADAVSYEANQYGQGLLTYSLLQGMKGAALKDQRSIETQTLFDYAADEVPKMATGIGGIQRPRVFGATGIPIGLMEDADKEKIKLESIKPIVLRPNLVLAGDTGADILGLTAEFRRRLNEASEAKPRGGGQGSAGASLIYIDEDKFPGGLRVTGTYSVDAKDVITLKAFLWRDARTPTALPEISAKDSAEAADRLIDELLKSLAQVK